METLRYLAQDGHTVICSIHHSRGSVYAKFDDVALLAGGSLIYVGPANDEVLAYFSKFGGRKLQHNAIYSLSNQVIPRGHFYGQQQEAFHVYHMGQSNGQ
ncbi:hypothetical protein AABB24_012494 [Solanum stoloniferum]|uniref:ABC transporter family G domain-containing protein n=1 Tax=Solanum stoloniferum TaxID=62892 RepID=A0ABD2U4A2_9SOLN